MPKYFKHKDILEKAKYFISYEYDDKSRVGKITCSLSKIDTYIIKYDVENEILYSSYQNISAPCPPYAAASLAECIVKNICKYYGYPYHFLFYDNSENKFRFFTGDKVKSDNLGMLIDDLYHAGLNNAIVELAKDTNIWDGVKSISQVLIGIDIK